MDFFSHIAWAYLLLFRYREDMVQGLFFGVFPDVLFVSAAILYSINLFAKSKQISRQKVFPIVRQVYSVSHSFITIAVFALITFVLNGEFYYPILGWVLHVLFDLYTHKGSPVEPQYPLFPLRTPAIKGIIWWRNPYFLVANWTAIIVIYTLT